LTRNLTRITLTMELIFFNIKIYISVPNI